jgi:hypothetical protein
MNINNNKYLLNKINYLNKNKLLLPKYKNIQKGGNFNENLINILNDLIDYMIDTIFENQKPELGVKDLLNTKNIYTHLSKKSITMNFSEEFKVIFTGDSETYNSNITLIKNHFYKKIKHEFMDKLNTNIKEYKEKNREMIDLEKHDTNLKLLFTNDLKNIFFELTASFKRLRSNYPTIGEKIDIVMEFLNDKIMNYKTFIIPIIVKNIVVDINITINDIDTSDFYNY